MIKFFSNKTHFILFTALIASLVFTGIILFSPKFEKYKAVIADSTGNHGNQFKIYEDIDGDGNSELFHMINDQSGFSHYVFYKDGKQLYQHNLKGHFLNMNFCIFGDYNHDSKKELYIPWYRADSIFMDVIDVISDKLLAKNIFLTQFKYHGKNLDTGIQTYFMKDFDNDGFDDLFFDMECGFSVTNRKNFIYSPKTKHLNVSQARGVNLYPEIILYDISNDGVPEIFGTRKSNGNTSEDYFLSDQKLWFYVPDVNHNFLFQPQIVGQYPGMVSTMPLYIENIPFIAALCVNWGQSYDSSFIATYNLKGELIKKVKMTYSQPLFESIFTSFPKEKPESLKILLSDGNLIEYDNQLNETNKLKTFRFMGLITKLDIDHDGKEEYFFQGLNNNLIITRDDYRYPVDIELDDISSPRYVSLKTSSALKPLICLNTEKTYYEIRYYKNPYYVFRHLIFIFLWFLLFFTFFIIGRLYQRIATKRYESENELARLQIAALEKQLSPHFILNILNSIGSLYETKQTEKAQNLLSKYGKLLHIVLFSSGKLSISLSQELEFTRDYIELEKARIINAFDYEIIFDESLSELQIPKMLIHSFCENAIKHGLRNLKHRNGFLKVNVFRKDNVVKIMVSDNGIGREKAKEYSSVSTGQGLKIIDQTLDTYFQLTKVRINYKISDIYNAEKKPEGTAIEITIPFHSN